MRNSHKVRFSTFIVYLAISSSWTKLSSEDSFHWSFASLDRIEVPKTESNWSISPIDVFVAQKLSEKGLSPSNSSERQALIRRLSMDLRGLPPTYAEVARFVADTSPLAYERIVERFLADPSYGERWAQHWLDVVRYADSDGFEYDTPRPNAWKYRDWVIDAWNKDKPYNQFVVEQIAGDQIAAGDPSKLIATGLHRLGPLRENAGNQDLEKNRQELLVEMTDMIGSAFLGLTIGCAKCHDHKFDPISQKDYYSLQAFFAGTIPADVPQASPSEVAAHQQREDEWKSQIANLKKQISGCRKKTKRKPGDPSGPSANGKLAKLTTELKRLETSRPEPPDTIMAVKESGSLTPTYVLIRGQTGDHGEAVSAQIPDSLPPSQTREDQSASSSKTEQSTQRRLRLAHWIADDRNALVARVIVNRLWQHHFGRGLVATPNDFGLMGETPSHPKLLDWLACELIRSGWSTKHIQQLIVQSATYRQSSQIRSDALKRDPENIFLWRMPLRRLDAESVRDAVLLAAGRLNRKRGGPGVRLRLSKENVALIYKGTWDPTSDVSELSRRSIYRFVKRNVQPSLFIAFDAPDTLVSCAVRSVSTHAGQALTQLNGEFHEQHAKLLATRIFREFGESGTEHDVLDHLVDNAYENIVSRDPTDDERKLACRFLQSQQRLIQQEQQTTQETGLEDAFTDFCLLLFNLDEFLFY